MNYEKLDNLEKGIEPRFSAPAVCLGPSRVPAALRYPPRVSGGGSARRREDMKLSSRGFEIATLTLEGIRVRVTSPIDESIAERWPGAEKKLH